MIPYTIIWNSKNLGIVPKTRFENLVWMFNKLISTAFPPWPDTQSCGYNSTISRVNPWVHNHTHVLSMIYHLLLSNLTPPRTPFSLVSPEPAAACRLNLNKQIISLNVFGLRAARCCALLVCSATRLHVRFHDFCSRSTFPAHLTDILRRRRHTPQIMPRKCVHSSSSIQRYMLSKLQVSLPELHVATRSVDSCLGCPVWSVDSGGVDYPRMEALLVYDFVSNHAKGGKATKRQITYQRRSFAG